ncbi:2-phospho-L-lactate transferase [Chromatiales bacterium (ex Bugula neritina AB1)]|nr:2-phospho-L-lactate transferase [Chromatiales bacterium (ex Bugula neritina AB1)]
MNPDHSGSSSIVDGKVIVLSGGVGGAKLVLGLSHAVANDQLVVVTNTGDDFDHFGLRICPDTDTVLYTLAGLSNTELGWGRANETWTFMQTIKELGGPDWFNLGDADLALHIVRTQALKSGKTLTQVIAQLAQQLGIGVSLLPMSDQPVHTRVNTPNGQLAFQEYFVRDRCEPAVSGFEFAGIAQAQPNPLLLNALAATPAVVVIAPSNPYVSVDPILSVPGMREAIKHCGAPIVAVSPIVAGGAIKGPAAKMMQELDVPCSVEGIAQHYRGFIDGLIIDQQDAASAEAIAATGLSVRIAPSIMRTLDDRIALARVTLEFGREITRDRGGSLSGNE